MVTSISPTAVDRGRFRSSWATGPVESAIAIVVGVLVGSVVLLLTGHDPVAAYGALVERTLLRPSGLQESLVRATPILIAGAAVLVAVRAGVWNIGVDGQVLIGALAGATVASHLTTSSRPVLWLAVVVIAGLAGALWALPPALLRARFGVNEIVSTIMFNYVALFLTAWLVKGPLRDPGLVTPQTPSIPRELRLTLLGDTRVHVGLLAAVAIVVVLGLALRWTVVGLELRVVGANPRAARYLLIPVRGYLAAAFLVSGALAGLAGANDVLSTKGTFQAEWNPEYGFVAFALVFLARRNAWAMLPAAILFGMLSYGGDVMPRAAGIDSSFFGLLEGSLLISLAVTGWLPGLIRRRRSAGGA